MATIPTPLAKPVDINQMSPGAVQSKVQQIQAASKGLDSAPAFVLAGSSIQNLQIQIYRLHDDLKKLGAFINGGGASSGFSLTIQEVAAVHAITTPIPASVIPVAGNTLIVFVTQDSTGGGLISWASLFRFAITNIDTTANTISVFTFVGRIDPADLITRWFMVTLPLTGQV